MTIWRIDADWKYQSLAYREEDDARYILAYGRGDLSKWQPVYVDYNTDVYDDTDYQHEQVPSFPSLSGLIACDEEAKSVLDELIYGHAEFLPLRSNTINDKQYYILYPKTVLDCVDTERSQYHYPFWPSTEFRSIKTLEFQADCLGDTPIFILPRPASRRPFVNDRFKQLVEDNNLAGLEFKKVWED